MLSEIQIRERKNNYLRAIENENEEISKELKEIERRKEYIKEFEFALKEINKILADNNG